MKLKETAIEFIEAKCNVMKNESSRDVVGEEVNDVLTFEGRMYNIWIQAFWEKSDWYEATVTGHGTDLKFCDEF